MIWILYILLHSIAHAYFNFCFITDIDFHTAQVIALGIDLLAVFYFKRVNFKKALIYLFVFCSVRWIVYDISLNLMLGKGVFYVGSGWLDQIFGFTQYAFKLAFLVISTYLMFIEKND